MSWVETESLSFTARHDSEDAAFADRTLDRLETLRLRLEDRVEAVPAEGTGVIPTNPASLTMAHPFLPAARWAAAPAGRRYLAGWPMETELHVLNDRHMERRAAGEGALEARRGARVVEGAPPSCARQVGLYRAAVLLRLRGGARISFPPSRRDAVILGGTIFDLLENERGPEACEGLVGGRPPGGPAVTLEDAFDARFRDIEGAWRDYLREMANPAGVR